MENKTELRTEKPRLLRDYPEYVLLGESKDFEGEVYLVVPEFQCGRYWGFGYLERWNDRIDDIDFHSHLDYELNRQEFNWRDGMKALFTKEDGTTGLIPALQNDNTLWRFCEVAQTIYTLKKTAEVLELGGSHITSNPCEELIQNAAEVDRLNTVVIPALIDELYKLLGV